MRRIWALYVNEMIKITRKVSVLIILALMLVSIFGFGGLMKFTEIINSKNQSQTESSQSQQKEEMQNNLNNYKTQLTEIKSKEKSASQEDLVSLQSQEKSLQSQIDAYQYAIDNNINLNSDNYLASAVQELFQYKGELSQLKELPAGSLDSDQKETMRLDSEYVSQLEKAVENKDFKAYLNFSNNQINNDKDLSDEEKQIHLEINELKARSEITGDTTGTVDSKSQTLSLIETEKRSLAYNLDYTSGNKTPRPLTATVRDKIKNDLAVNIYKLEHNGIVSANTTDYQGVAMTGMTGLGVFMLVILGMILAGGSISQEIATGSIKSLIISPAKRWKIFIAKALSLLSVGVAGLLIAYAASILAFGLFFGFHSGTPYLYATNGSVHVMNFYIFYLARYFVELVKVIVYMMLALMLSVITRNTAASVGIAMAVYFGGSIANSFLLLFAKGEWLKFIPFNNLDLISKIFPESAAQMVAISGGSSGSGTAAVNSSLLFMVGYLIVIFSCMWYTAFDSFNRRDIK